VAAATPPRPAGAAARETPAAVREASSSGPEHGKRQRRPTAATPAVEMEPEPNPRFFTEIFPEEQTNLEWVPDG